MDKFIAQLNIDHYRKVLACERDPERRRLVGQLLAEEEAKLAAIEHRSEERKSDPATVDDAVSHLNLTYYRKRLVNETDLVIRQILIRLIEEEEARATPASTRKVSGDD